MLSSLIVCLTLASCSTTNLSTHVYTSPNNDASARPPTVDTEQSYPSSEQVAVGAERMILGAERFANYLPLLEGKRVSLVVNQSALVAVDNIMTPAPSPTPALKEGGASKSSTTHLNENDANKRYL